MRGVGGEPGQDAIWLAVGKGVDLDCVVGACCHQLAVLWGKKTPQTHAATFHPPNMSKVIQDESEVANLHSEGVHLFSNGDELWIVIIQTFPYPNISVVTTCYKEPGQKCFIVHLIN